MREVDLVQHEADHTLPADLLDIADVRLAETGVVRAAPVMRRAVIKRDLGPVGVLRYDRIAGLPEEREVEVREGQQADLAAGLGRELVEGHEPRRLVEMIEPEMPPAHDRDRGTVVADAPGIGARLLRTVVLGHGTAVGAAPTGHTHVAEEVLHAGRVRQTRHPCFETRRRRTVARGQLGLLPRRLQQPLVFR